MEAASSLPAGGVEQLGCLEKWESGVVSCVKHDILGHSGEVGNIFPDFTEESPCWPIQ
jgi:hypothetical protein